ncbi:gas vesicle protein GvpO [Embleya sp. NPDC050493]|uniref:gas vesicle protein GvpO n=1 Tax=Embleya sp. NPDC050493 TaxID=3363989 RepID=UPI0037B7764E
MRSADREPGDAESERRRPARDKPAPKRATSGKRVARSTDETAPAPRRSVARRSPADEERESPERRLKRRAAGKHDTRAEDADHAAQADDAAEADDRDEARPRRASPRRPREGHEGDRRKRRRPPESAPVKPLQAAAAAADQLRALTGREPEGIVSAERVDAGWRIGIEVLEAQRIPDSTDILALYVVEVDDEGEMTSYRRDRRYYRGRAEET